MYMAAYHPVVCDVTFFCGDVVELFSNIGQEWVQEGGLGIAPVPCGFQILLVKIMVFLSFI